MGYLGAVAGACGKCSSNKEALKSRSGACFPHIFPTQRDVTPPALGQGSGCRMWGTGTLGPSCDTLPCPTTGWDQLFLPRPLTVLSWPIWLSPLIYWDIFSRL